VLDVHNRATLLGRRVDDNSKRGAFSSALRGSLRLLVRKASAFREAVSPTRRHGCEGFIHLSSMHAGGGMCTAQHFTGQAINNACLGRSKREQFFGSCRTSSWWRTFIPVGSLHSCTLSKYCSLAGPRMMFIFAFSVATVQTLAPCLLHMCPCATGWCKPEVLATASLRECG
jgi:hypothetical protein